MQSEVFAKSTDFQNCRAVDRQNVRELTSRKYKGESRTCSNKAVSTVETESIKVVGVSEGGIILGS